MNTIYCETHTWERSPSLVASRSMFTVTVTMCNNCPGVKITQEAWIKRAGKWVTESTETVVDPKTQE